MKPADVRIRIINLRTLMHERNMVDDQMKDSILKKLTESETIPGAYEGWERYRKQVTDYIINTIEKLGKPKPVVCIWGAGKANDIDLARLEKYGKLILIDRDIASLKKAKAKYALDDNTVLTDIPFWHISEEDYKMYEALLADGADAELVISQLTKIGEHNRSKMNMADGFIADISVAAGIHSQLNSRLAALLYAYRNHYEEQELLHIENSIAGLNDVAIERMNDLLYQVTAEIIIYGYELLAVYGDEAEALKAIEGIKKKDDTVIKNIHLIEGAKQLAKDISVHKDCDMEIVDNLYLPWNFSFAENKKTYVMELLSCRKKK